VYGAKRKPQDGEAMSFAWVVLLWAVSQQPNCSSIPSSLCYSSGCEKLAVEIDGGCPVAEQPAPTQPQTCTVTGDMVTCPSVTVTSRGPFCYQPAADAPVEHVFEIRTKTQDHGEAKDERKNDLGGEPHCADPDDLLSTPDQCHEGTCTSLYITAHCIRVTRELWIDGVKVGVVKGLD
jgi:hypothetical protein